MKCPSCAADNVYDAVYCRTCKTPLASGTAEPMRRITAFEAGPEAGGRAEANEPGYRESTPDGRYATRPEAPVRRTQYVPQTPDSSEPRVAMERIVAVLITYTWKPEGEIFPIREGRNRIGRDAALCDISLAQDDTLSATHSSITYRKRFAISDSDSKAGTYVNGEPVEEQFYPLENYAQIRTGATVWTFVIVDPAKQLAATS